MYLWSYEILFLYKLVLIKNFNNCGIATTRCRGKPWVGVLYIQVMTAENNYAVVIDIKVKGTVRTLLDSLWELLIVENCYPMCHRNLWRHTQIRIIPN